MTRKKGYKEHAVNSRLQAFLNEHEATAHVHNTQRPVYTTQKLASVEHVSKHTMAKIVMAVADKKIIILVLPASLRVDLKQMRDSLGAHKMRLATETKFEKRFPDCKINAIPPFKHLYKLPVYVDPELTATPTIVFKTNSHREIRMIPFMEFQQLKHPHVAPLTN